MLVLACEEVVERGGIPEEDPAVALISGRISFASPTDCMSNDSWQALVNACRHQVEGAAIKIKKENTQ